MKDIKNGEYVRFENGVISQMEEGKIIGDFLFSEVVRISPDIMDLLEEQDLVKIEFYSPRYEERVTRLFEVTFKDEQYINLDNAKCQFMLTNGKWSWRDKKLNPVIKSVITREQIEKVEYII